MKTIHESDDYCLVVVDMQPLFTRHAQTVNNVKREVFAARKAGRPVVFLEIEYDEQEPHLPYGSSHQCLLDAVDGYEHAHVSRRIGRRLPAPAAHAQLSSAISWNRPKVPGQDGSRGVVRLCQQQGYAMNRFRVCGVQADLCVLSTVKGLLKKTEARIEVVDDATSTIPRMRRFWRAKFPEGRRLKIV